MLNFKQRSCKILPKQVMISLKIWKVKEKKTEKELK